MSLRELIDVLTEIHLRLGNYVRVLVTDTGQGDFYPVVDVTEDGAGPDGGVFIYYDTGGQT